MGGKTGECLDPIAPHENAVGGASYVLTRSQEAGEGVGAPSLAEFIEFGSLGAPVELRRRTSMPLAHPRLSGGVILAAAVVRSALGADPPTTLATRMNLLEAVGVDLSLPLGSRGDSRCRCDDPLFRDVCHAKYA